MPIAIPGEPFVGGVVAAAGACATPAAAGMAAGVEAGEFCATTFVGDVLAVADGELGAAAFDEPMPPPPPFCEPAVSAVITALTGSMPPADN